jgi:hypothetical protein
MADELFVLAEVDSLNAIFTPLKSAHRIKVSTSHIFPSFSTMSVFIWASGQKFFSLCFHAQSFLFNFLTALFCLSDVFRVLGSLILHFKCGSLPRTSSIIEVYGFLINFVFIGTNRCMYTEIEECHLLGCGAM